MCYDPWEHGIRKFTVLYFQAVYESTRQDRPEQHRHQWSGKVEFFEQGYVEKLVELDDEDLEEWLDNIENMDKRAQERLLEPAENEQKRRAEKSADVH